jgi:hypothetical protein
MSTKVPTTTVTPETVPHVQNQYVDQPTLPTLLCLWVDNFKYREFCMWYNYEPPYCRPMCRRRNGVHSKHEDNPNALLEQRRLALSFNNSNIHTANWEYGGGYHSYHNSSYSCPYTNRTYHTCWRIWKCGVVIDHSMADFMLSGPPSSQDDWWQSMHLSCSTSTTEEQNMASPRYLSLCRSHFTSCCPFLQRDSSKKEKKMLDIQGEQHLNMFKLDLSK